MQTGIYVAAAEKAAIEAMSLAIQKILSAKVDQSTMVAALGTLDRAFSGTRTISNNTLSG